MCACKFEMQKISKSFPGVQALKNVDFNCMDGEVHALIGENGAGKSTLMKILSGVYQQNEGKIVLRGTEIRFSSPKEAQRHGISTIYQELNLIPELNVAENIFLGHEPSRRMGFVDKASLYSRAREVLARFGVNLDLRTKVKHLSVAEQQMVEIAKSLCIRADIMIMDEPSAAVSGEELEVLFDIIRTLKKQKMAIVYISHRIDEIFQIADRATVLKDGELVGTINLKDVSKTAIIKMMVGRTLSETFPDKEKGKRELLLSLKDINKGKLLKDISLSVYTGEILGVAGLVGSGRTDLAKLIFGVHSPDDGEMILKGKRIGKHNPENALKNGIGFITEDRKREGIFHCLSIRKNLTSLILDRIQKWCIIKEGAERQISRRNVRDLKILPPNIERPIEVFSGGNQQKVILSKWLNAESILLIMDEPTRGIDVGAKAEFYTLMRALALDGAAIMMISSELPEILGMSDRIIVMHEGRIVGELDAAEATEEAIMRMATNQVTQKYEGDEPRES